MPVDDYRHLQRLSADAEAGKTVKLEIVRNRNARPSQLKIAEAPDTVRPHRPRHTPTHAPIRARQASPASPSPSKRRGPETNAKDGRLATEPVPRKR